MMEWIEGYENVASVFGRWTSFHDAEVLALHYERTEAGFDVKIAFHTWETTDATDAQGYFDLHKQTRVEFLFEDCENERLSGFNGQNVVFGLDITRVPADPDGREIEVSLEPCYGLSGHLRCRRAVVTDASPYAVQEA